MKTGNDETTRIASSDTLSVISAGESSNKSFDAASYVQAFVANRFTTFGDLTNVTDTQKLQIVTAIAKDDTNFDDTDLGKGRKIRALDALKVTKEMINDVNSGVGGGQKILQTLLSDPLSADIAIVEELVARGGNIHEKTNGGKSPNELARTIIGSPLSPTQKSDLKKAFESGQKEYKKREAAKDKVSTREGQVSAVLSDAQAIRDEYVGLVSEETKAISDEILDAHRNDTIDAITRDLEKTAQERTQAMSQALEDIAFGETMGKIATFYDLYKRAEKTTGAEQIANDTKEEISNAIKELVTYNIDYFRVPQQEALAIDEQHERLPSKMEVLMRDVKDGILPRDLLHAVREKGLTPAQKENFEALRSEIDPKKERLFNLDRVVDQLGIGSHQVNFTDLPGVKETELTSQVARRLEAQTSTVEVREIAEVTISKNTTRPMTKALELLADKKTPIATALEKITDKSLLLQQDKNGKTAFHAIIEGNRTWADKHNAIKQLLSAQNDVYTANRYTEAEQTSHRSSLVGHQSTTGLNTAFHKLNAGFTKAQKNGINETEIAAINAIGALFNDLSPSALQKPNHIGVTASFTPGIGGGFRAGREDDAGSVIDDVRRVASRFNPFSGITGGSAKDSGLAAEETKSQSR